VVSYGNTVRGYRTDVHCVLKLREYIKRVNVIQLFVRGASMEAVLCRQLENALFSLPFPDMNPRVLAYLPRRVDKLLCIELLKTLQRVAARYLHFSQLPEDELRRILSISKFRILFYINYTRLLFEYEVDFFSRELIKTANQVKSADNNTRLISQFSLL